MLDTVRIGVFQLKSHPALVVGDVDYLCEPFPGADLCRVAREHLVVADCLGKIKQQYVTWCTTRLVELLEWLAKQDNLPHYVLFPECAIPFECLELLKTYAKRMGVTFFAGTHSPVLSQRGKKHYKALGASSSSIKLIFNDERPTSAILPIISEDSVDLHLKGVPSVFEITDMTRRKKKDKTERKPIRVAGEHSVLVLICAEL